MDYIKIEDIPEEFVGLANFMGIDKNKVQINLAFECYNPQNYRVQFHISFIIYNGKLRSLGEQVLSEYCKEATTDDKT